MLRLRGMLVLIYVDSRKRVAGSDSDFEVDLGESLHLQSDARLAVYKIRIADSFLSTDRGRYLYWVDAALGTLNWALLPKGAYTGSRLAAWISSNFATAAYSKTTNSLSVAYDGNRLILNDLELQQQFPSVVDYPTLPAASPSKPSARASSPVGSRSTYAAPSWPTPAACWAILCCFWITSNPPKVF